MTPAERAREIVRTRRMEWRAPKDLAVNQRELERLIVEAIEAAVTEAVADHNVAPSPAPPAPECRWCAAGEAPDESWNGRWYHFGGVTECTRSRPAPKVAP